MRGFIVLLLVLSPSLAEACYRCGNYKRCVYYSKPAYVAPAVTPVNIWNTTNVYPPTIGQGATTFRSVGYQQASYNQFDRTAWMHGNNEVAKAMLSSVNGLMARADVSAQLFSAQDAPVALSLANASAAETTLNALGLNITNAQVAPQSTGMLVQRNAQGQWQVLQLDSQAIARMNGNGYQNGGQQYGQQQPQSNYPMLTQFCARCHSPDLAEPKGGIYIGDHPSVAASMKERFFSIVDQVSTGKMPPPGEQQPNKEQVASLFNEVQQIIKYHANTPAPRYQPQFQAAPSNEPPPAPLPPQQPQPLPQPQQGT